MQSLLAIYVLVIFVEPFCRKGKDAFQSNAKRMTNNPHQQGLNNRGVMWMQKLQLDWVIVAGYHRSFGSVLINYAL
jgi:hypothetical protein